MQKIAIKVKGMAKSILVCTSFKLGKEYTSYMVADYCEGKRKRWIFADLEEAKGKAREIMEGHCPTGQLLRSERAEILHRAAERGCGYSGGNTALEEIKRDFRFGRLRKLCGTRETLANYSYGDGS
jgi:hypothetical protein